MTALDALHQAHQAWIRTQPQLFFELDETPGTPHSLPGVSSSPNGSPMAPVHVTPFARPTFPGLGVTSGRHPLQAPSTINRGPTATTLDGHCAVGPQEVTV